MVQVGTRIDQAKSEHDTAMGRLSTGKDNLIGKVERLKTLGANSTKLLPPRLIGGCNNNERGLPSLSGDV